MDKKIKQLEKEIKTLKLQLKLFAKWTKETSANIDFNSYAQIENIIDNKINSNIQNIGDELEEILQMNNEQLNNEL